MTSYESTLETLVERIEALISEHPEIMSLDSAWGLAGPHDQIDDWGRAWSGTYFYVSNGAFITAALAEGYKGRRAAEGDLNMRFNLRIKKEDR